ncbi:hypothetical protein [Ferruginibacter profundus]
MKKPGHGERHQLRMTPATVVTATTNGHYCYTIFMLTDKGVLSAAKCAACKRFYYSARQAPSPYHIKIVLKLFVKPSKNARP